MKKIVGILAVAAMATSLFAADVAAAIQGYGDLLNVKGGKVSALGWNDPWDREFSWYSTGIGFSATADKAGLSFELDNRDVTVKTSNFWIQPLDMVKIALGANSIGLAKESIEYAGTVFNCDYEGWKITLTPVDGLTIDAGLVTGCKGEWATSYYLTDGKIGETLASVAYNAGDVGTFTAVYDYNGDNTIGLDYVGNFGDVMVSPAVAYTITANKLAADLFVTGNFGAFGMNLYTKYDAGLAAKTNEVAVNTKFTYNTSIGQASLQVKNGTILAAPKAFVVKGDLAFNCGSAGMNVGVQYDVAKNEISVPFQYNLHF